MVVTCANGHGDQVPGGTCTVCGLALPTPEMQVWGMAQPLAGPHPPLASGSATQETAHTRPPHFDGAIAGPAAQDHGTARRGRLWIGLGVIAATFIVAGGATYFALTRLVPDVLGMSPQAAKVELGKAGFAEVTVEEEFSDSTPRGLVAGQEPEPSARARSGAAITLIVSRGEPKEVPSLIGETTGGATRAVRGLSLEMSRSEQPSDYVPEGVVLGQDPSPGTILEEGDRVSIVVSSGPPYTTVTVELDLFSVVLDNDFTDCDDAILVLRLFANSSIENGAGRSLSRLSGLWDPMPGNGDFFPCKAVGTFPRTPTQEASYRLLLDSSDRGSGRSYSRAELERQDWTISLG